MKSLKGQSVDHCSTIAAPESLIYEKSVHVQVQNTDATKVNLGGGYHAVYKVHVQDS